MILSVFAGAVVSYMHILNPSLVNGCLQITEVSLLILLFLIGFDIGNNRESLRTLLKADRHALLIPAGTIIGTLFGGFLVSLVTDLTPNEGMAIASGFGWHSLSAVLLAEMKGSDIGAIAFLSNVFRESITLISIPFLVKLVGPYAAIAPGGATTMDVTLPVIEKYCGKKAAIVGFINGVILSTLVPIVLPLF